jgi:hypothetical protein
VYSLFSRKTYLCSWWSKFSLIPVWVALVYHKLNEGGQLLSSPSRLTSYSMYNSACNIYIGSILHQGPKQLQSGSIYISMATKL